MRPSPFLRLMLAPVAILAGCQSGAEAPLETESPPAPMSVVPSALTIDGGNRVILIARVRDADGHYSAPSDVAWCSANSDVASVDPEGRVEGLKPGKAQIVATWHGSRGSSVITVVDANARKLEPPPVVFEKRGTVPPAPGCAAAPKPSREAPPR